MNEFDVLPQTGMTPDTDPTAPAEEDRDSVMWAGFEEQEAELEELSEEEQGFADMYDQTQQLFSERGKALNTTTMLTALAQADTSKNISMQITERTLGTAREALEMGQEQAIRYGLVQRQAQAVQSGLAKVIGDLGYSPDAGKLAASQQAYANIQQWDTERKARTALEEAAIEKIQLMAASDPVQARVLLDNLEYGDADQTIKNFNVKLAILRQRSEELDDEYQQSGWGRYAVNMLLNIVPLNWNFAQTGTIGTAGFKDIFAVGEAKRRESNALWNMPLEEFAEFAARDGALMQSIKDNATSIFEIGDPGAAIHILDDLTAQSDSSRVWNNIWGGAEIAMAVPWTKLGTATRTLVSSGAPKDAVRNIANAIEIADREGVEAATRATGVTEREIVDELGVSAVRGTDDFVPLSEPVESFREAAKQASRELFNSPEISSFRTEEELQAWVTGRIDEIRAQIGSPIKDIQITTVKLPGGRDVRQVSFTVGKKDGFGFASETAAKQGLKRTGFAGEVFEEATERSVARFSTKSTLKDLTVTRSAEDGLSFFTAKIVTEGGDELPVSLRMTDDGKGTIDIGGLNANELGAVEMRGLAAKLADEIPELKTLQGPRATGARKAARDAGGTNVPDEAIVDVTALRGRTRIVRDMSGQYFAKITMDMPEAGWLVGKLEPPQQGFVSKMIGRWFQAAPRISDQTLHGQALEAGSYLNRAQKHIDEEVMGVFRSLPKQSREIVSALGKYSSIKERWLTPTEINIAVERQWGRAATEVEQKAYADLRLFNDMDWELRNAYMYLDGVQKGKESVTYTTKWGEDIVDDVKVDYKMENVPTERVYDASRGKHYVHGRNSLDTKTLTTMKNNGYVMITHPNGFKLPEGIVVNKVLIKKTDIKISPLRREQLAYAPGGHRMYTAPVFVKQGRKGKQADTGTEYLSTPSTFRTAENIGEGKRWADRMNEARLAVKENRAISAQELDDLIFKNESAFPTGEEFLNNIADDTYRLDEPFEAVYDRELPSMYNTSGEDVARMFNEDELGINGYYRTTGRMYTSAKGEVLRDTKGELAEVLDPYDTLSRSLSQVTRQIGLYNYKTNAIERFASTYKGFLISDPNVKSSAQLLMDAAVSPTVSREMRNQIESQRAAILNVLRFQTPADRAATQMWQDLTAKVLGDGTNAGRKAAHDALNWFKNKDPVGSMRGLAFDMKLGMFNIAQLVIQSSTMISAMAISPKFGMRGMAGLLPMHAYILKGGSENVLDLMTKRGVGKVMGFESADEFKDYARHAYKHGFMEMNGSHIMINNYGPNSHFGSFGETATRAREQARVFFYTSETWNRLVAYRIAWGEATAKGLRPNHPEFNATVLKAADDYSFNMTSESAAYWQKGLLSIPTQFWAYNMRMMDAMFGSHITGAARARLIAVNFGMAGAAGIPGLQALSEFAKQKYGAAPDIDSIQGVADRGVIDYINYQMTGNDVIIGERVGTGGWATQVVKTLFGKSEYGEQSFADVAGGATYSIAKSTSSTIWNLAKYAAAEGNTQDGLGDITSENLINLMKEVSTFSNANKAMMLHQYGMYKSNKGTIMVSDLPPGHAMYAALSFRPAKADEIGYMLEYSKNREENIKEIAKKLRNWRQEALITGDYEKHWKKANTLINLLPVQDRREVIRQTNSIDQESFHEYVEQKVSEEQAMDTAMEGLE